MIKEDKKLYERAMKFYGKGNIDKALELCEKAISCNMKNSSALNLKGLLLYIKGELKGATDAWKINWDFNNNSLSRGYLKDSKEDEKRLVEYIEALNMIKELKIREALEKLYFCAESDFNLINVYNALAYCYIKTGDFKKADDCINKVLSANKNNKAAMDNKKLLSEFNVIDNNNNVKKIGIIVAIIIVLGTITWNSIGPIKNYISGTTKINNIDKSKNQNIVKEQTKDKSKEEKDNKSKNNTSKVEENSQIITSFDIKKVLSAIDNKDYNGIYKLLENVNKENLDINNRNIYDKANKVLQREGIESFYKQGTKYFKANDFEKANIEFIKAYKFSDQNYLRPHIQFMLANSFEKLNDVESACKYYEEYVSENRDKENKNYMEESLYKLATLYKSTEKEKSIKYAKELTEKYPRSIYNNSTIKEILK